MYLYDFKYYWMWKKGKEKNLRKSLEWIMKTYKIFLKAALKNRSKNWVRIMKRLCHDKAPGEAGCHKCLLTQIHIIL